MAAGDLILSNGVAISPEDIRLIAEEAKKILASESKEITQYEQVSSLTNISSFPAILQQGTALKLVRVAMDLLKGVDGKNIELSSSSEAILWRLEGSQQWNTLVSLSSLKGDKGNAGEPITLRKSETGIDWKYINDDETKWQNIVQIEDIKLKYSDLSASDKSELTKIPVLNEVVADKGLEPSGSFKWIGLDDKGNPQYSLNLTLPRGEAGVPPILEAGEVETKLPDTDVEVSVTDNGYTEDGRPKYKLNFKIPAGKPGQDGDGAGNVYVVTDNIKSGQRYVFQATSDASANGTFVEIENVDGVGKTYESIYPNGEIFNDYEKNIAFGQYAHAEGRETNATGSRAHAEGYLSRVFAADAHGEGRETWCLAAQGHSEGLYSISYGAISHVEGCAFDTDRETPATRVILSTKDEEFIRTLYDNEDYFLLNFDKTIGINEKFYEDFIFHGSFGERNHVEGVNNSILCNSSHVEGFNNIVGYSISGHSASQVHHAVHVEGGNNKFVDSGKMSGVHIEGLDNSIIESSNTTINADGSQYITYYDAAGSHAEGHDNSIITVKYDESSSQYTYGSAEASHVGGAYCSVELADYAFAHGYYLTVKNKYETSFGRYNASELDGKKVLFSYGIGSSDANRKNAISVFEDGSVAIPNLVGFDTDINQKLESLESKLTETINTFNNRIINIYNKLSNGDITSPVFVINDTLIITNRINTVITDTDLAINDEMFIFSNGDLSYNSNDGYLTKATYENGNLIFESTNE